MPKVGKVGAHQESGEESLLENQPWGPAVERRVGTEGVESEPDRKGDADRGNRPPRASGPVSAVLEPCPDPDRARIFGKNARSKETVHLHWPPIGQNQLQGIAISGLSGRPDRKTALSVFCIAHGTWQEETPSHVAELVKNNQQPESMSIDVDL